MCIHAHTQTHAQTHTSTQTHAGPRGGWHIWYRCGGRSAAAAAAAAAAADYPSTLVGLLARVSCVSGLKAGSRACDTLLWLKVSSHLIC